MKILVFADLHGSVNGATNAVEISTREKPDKTVFCGDIFGGWNNCEKQVAEILRRTEGVLYFVRGNNDRPSYDYLLEGGFEDYAVMYHFGRTLFFTHGDSYNGWRVPPILGENDALVFGHTHMGSLTRRNGLFLLNVGSVAHPRNGEACYLVLDESGATLKALDGREIFSLNWQ